MERRKWVEKWCRKECVGMRGNVHQYMKAPRKHLKYRTPEEEPDESEHEGEDNQAVREIIERMDVLRDDIQSRRLHTHNLLPVESILIEEDGKEGPEGDEIRKHSPPDSEPE